MDYEAFVQQANAHNSFMKHLGIKMTLMREDYSELEMEILEEHYNPVRIVHGGVYFTIADCAAGVAARSLGERYVTLNSSFNFIRAVSKGKLRAIGKVLSRGGTICVVHTQVFDDAGALVADGTFTMYRMKPRP